MQTVIDLRRGCGYRKPGALYLMADGPGKPCGRFPVPLKVCPCCGAGIKPCLGWTWVNGTELITQQGCVTREECGNCPAANPSPAFDRCGLLWIGAGFYKTTSEWLDECEAQGVSRRVKALPKGFEIGETWVLFAHREATYRWDTAANDGIREPGIFHATRPSRVEYVTKGDETEEGLERLEKRGITPVRVKVDMGPEGIVDLDTARAMEKARKGKEAEVE